MNGDGAQQRALVEALVLNGHSRLFCTSALFHAQIIGLAQLLPMWVEGMAARAEAQCSEHDRQVYEAMHSIPSPLIVKP